MIAIIIHKFSSIYWPCILLYPTERKREKRQRESRWRGRERMRKREKRETDIQWHAQLSRTKERGDDEKRDSSEERQREKVSLKNVCVWQKSTHFQGHSIWEMCIVLCQYVLLQQWKRNKILKWINFTLDIIDYSSSLPKNI